MAETRSQLQIKEAAVKEFEAALGPRIEQVLAQSQSLEGRMTEQFALQDAKIDKNIADMFEAIRLHTVAVNLQQINEPVRIHRPGPPNSYSGVTRLAKLDFPRFNGDKIKEWLFKIEQFFAIDRTPDELKVGLASIHFDDQAATWHLSIVQSESGPALVMDWQAYKALLKERFEEILDDPIAELKLLQETDGIVDYHDKFELIGTRVTLPEAYLVSAYLDGLRIDTQMHLRMFQPQSISQCLLLGRLYEKAHPRKNQSNTWQQSRSTTGGNQFKGLLPFNKNLEPRTTSMGVSEKGRETLAPSKFLTSEQMNERRAKGLCYYCDEKYTPGHHLKHKKIQLYMLECDEDMESVDEETEDEIHEEEPQISVSAVAGTSDYRTMSVKGVHEKRALFILIDSGSTHNFFGKSIAERLGCHLQSVGNTKVSVADGSTLQVCGRVDKFKWSFQRKWRDDKFKWSFQNVEFQADFMVIPLGCCDMVLGIQWLETLGIQWIPQIPEQLDEKREEESLNRWYAEEGASIGRVKHLTYCDHLGTLCSDLVHIPSESPCSRCDHTAENWLCLSCKDVLCSRYVNKHMLKHYEQKGHCLALSYSNLSVWCFNCEAYLDAAVIQQLRPVYETAYILKFGEAPPVRIGAYFQLE